MGKGLTRGAERRWGAEPGRYTAVTPVHTTSQAGEPRKILDSDTPQNLKTLEINGAHDEMHNPFRPHIAAITNISVVDRYSTVTRPLHVRYVRYSTSNTQALDILAFWGGVKR